MTTTTVAPKVIEAAIRANRRALELLDQRLMEVSKVVPDVTKDLLRAQQSLAFSYVVDFSGAPATNVAGVPVSGYVRMESDSAFLLSGIYVVPFASNNVFDTSKVDMMITEEDSGHQITLVGRDNRAVTTAMPTPGGIAVQAFAMYNQLDRGRFELPAECIYPRNALIRVDLFSNVQIRFSTNNRNFIVLHGTKMFGG